MDRSNSNSSTDEQAAEKKMKVDMDEINPVDLDAEMTLVDGDLPSLHAKEDSNANGAEAHAQAEPKILSDIQSPSCIAAVVTDDDTVSSNTGKSELVDSTTTEEETVLNLAPSVEDFGELIELKVVFNKQQLKITMPIRKTVGDLKLLIEKQTKVAPELQKVVLKGIPKDDATLESLGITKLTKIMVIGTTLSDVMAIAKPPDKEAASSSEWDIQKDNSNWCTLPQHKKVIDKGVPDDAMPGILDEHDPLPEIPLFGMLNKAGGKVRLTFKMALDELWIGTKERTEKVSIGSIRYVESQPITGYEHYHILAIQLGPTEASRFFVYWVPAQYIEAIKNALEM